jgi:2-keto-4-pentenoate hydratase
MDRTNDTTLSGVDRDRLHQAAELLLEARRTVQPIDDLPPGMAPKTLEEAYYIQDLMLQAIGKAGGWKVGAMTPDGTPFYAPMPLDGFTTSGELLESGLLDPDAVDRLTAIADLQSNGGFISGSPVEGWQDFDFANESAQMNVDGFVRVANGKNAAGGDLLRLVLWLANEAQSRTGGLLAGQWITTGSWTGKIMADSGSVALARFLQFGEVTVRFD